MGGTTGPTFASPESQDRREGLRKFQKHSGCHLALCGQLKDVDVQAQGANVVSARQIMCV